MSNATVYFVGAGPGDPGLITVKGKRLLEQADCVIYDGLANPALLGHCQGGIETISVAKRSGHHSVKQPEINALIVEKAKQYKHLVRLKGGDPCLFGRAVEEIKTCIEAGLDFEIVPGITAGVAAAEYAGIFLTDRDHTSAVCFATGREAEGKPHTDLNWDALAKFNGSLVIYMGMGNLETICQTLAAQGKPIETPAAVIQQATGPRQRMVKGTLANIARLCEAENIAAPAIVILGASAAGIEQANWFTDHPLFGKRIVITRDVKGNQLFAEKLSAVGAEPIAFNAIEILDKSQDETAQAALRDLSAYDWVVLTSANGVTHTFEALVSMQKDARTFAAAKIACIGQQTADTLKTYGIAADFVPSAFTSVALAKELAEFDDLNGKKILLLRSAIAPKDLPQQLSSSGAIVTDAAVYTVRAKQQNGEFAESVRRQIADDQVDAVTFTSSSTVGAFFASVSPELLAENQIKIVSIGPATTAALEGIGLKADCTASVHTVEGMVAEMTEMWA